MRNHSTRTTHRRRSFRRSDRGLRLTVTLAVAGIAAIPLVGLIPFAGTTPPPAPIPTVWVACTDGTGCAVPPSKMDGHLVVHCDYYVTGGPCIPWTAGAKPPSQHLSPSDDPGANI